MNAPSLGERALASPWVRGQPGLGEAVAGWDANLVEVRASLKTQAAKLATPGPVLPRRAAQHLAALQAAQLRWALLRLPGDLAGGLRPVRAPGTWLKQTIAHVLRDQLAVLGPAGAEVARIIEESEGLAPGVVVDELRRRPIESAPLPVRDIERIVRVAFNGAVRRVVAGPVSATPISQLHRAELTDGTAVFVRARRPGVRAAVRADARITAALVAPFEWLLPPMREAHPLGFVELAARQLLEEADLRHEALNAVELGLVAEELDRPGVLLCRPVPRLVDSRAVATEALDGGVPLAHNPNAAARLDRDACIAGLVAVTVESALTAGVFHADLRPEHLLALPDGRIAIVGCGTVGRFDPAMRGAALDYLAAVLSGDFEGQVAAMRVAGAVPEGIDEDRLIADLAATATLQPMTILSGGEVSLLAALREAMNLLLRHQLRPPVEVALFLRTIFSLRALLGMIAPERSLLEALFPVIQRLPDLRVTSSV